MMAAADAHWSADARAAEDALFGDTLACEAVLPAGFVPGGAANASRAEALLLGLARVEDLRGGDDAGEDKRGELPLLAQRLDAKLDLVLALLARLVRQSGRPLPPVPLRWSVRGLRLRLPERAEPPAAGTAGAVCLQPADWLPDELELPVVVAACDRTGDAVQVWLRFPDLPEGLEEAMGRHLFRMHRRQVAGARRR